MAKNYLMTPGPTPVPEEIRIEMAKPIIHHRTKEYQAIFKETIDWFRKSENIARYKPEIYNI